MKMISGYNCLLASAAMVLDVHPDVLIKLIGHDGKKIIFPELLETINTREFHTQEITDCAFEYGYAVTEIEALPCLTPNGKDAYIVDFNVSNERRFWLHADGHIGIFTGRIKELGHAVAWDGEMIFDPRGKVYTYEDAPLDIDSFYRFDKIISKKII